VPIAAALQRFGERLENKQVSRPKKVRVLPGNLAIQQLLTDTHFAEHWRLWRYQMRFLFAPLDNLG
jgi:hypothetical protein